MTTKVTSRLIDSVANTQITGLITSTQLAPNASFPVGGIIMWSGSIASIPSGWLLCDGTNGTPDLRDRFIVGAGSSYSVAGTGGSKDAIVVSHTHTGTTASTSLTGSASRISETFELAGSASGIFSKQSGFPGNGTPTSIDTSNSAQLSIDATHTHTFTTASSGSSGTNANLPPYYALAFIMKS